MNKFTHPNSKNRPAVKKTDEELYQDTKVNAANAMYDGLNRARAAQQQTEKRQANVMGVIWRGTMVNTAILMIGAAGKNLYY